MFRIEDFRIAAGRIRMVIETDTASSAALLRFFSAADAFAQAYHFRVRGAIAADRRANDPERIRIVEEERCRRARYLTLYRSLPGSRRERLRALREYAAADGHPLGYDAAIVLVSHAGKELKEARRARIGQLREGGYSLRAIAATLGIPLTTVERLGAAPKRGEALKCPRIDDLPSPAYRGAVFSGERSSGKENQRKRALPTPGAPPVSVGFLTA